MRLIKTISAVTIVSICLPSVVMAHSALCSCFNNGDGTVVCEGGFSDGSSAAGVRIFVRELNGKTLIRGVIGEDGEFSFSAPAVEYKVVFDAGPGHQVVVNGEDIVE